MSDTIWSEEFVTTPAMTLREYYAGLAMQGLAVHASYEEDTSEQIAKLSGEY